MIYIIECDIPHIVLKVVEDNDGLYYYRLLDIINGMVGISYEMIDVAIDKLIDDGLIEVWGSTYMRKRVFSMNKKEVILNKIHNMDDIYVIARRMVNNV